MPGGRGVTARLTPAKSLSPHPVCPRHRDKTRTSQKGCAKNWTGKHTGNITSMARIRPAVRRQARSSRRTSLHRENSGAIWSPCPWSTKIKSFRAFRSKSYGQAPIGSGSSEFWYRPRSSKGPAQLPLPPLRMIGETRSEEDESATQYLNHLRRGPTRSPSSAVPPSKCVKVRGRQARSSVG